MDDGDAFCASATMRGRPCPLQRGQRTSRNATRMEASGLRDFTRKSRSTTVPQLSLAAYENYPYVAYKATQNQG